VPKPGPAEAVGVRSFMASQPSLVVGARVAVVVDWAAGPDRSCAEVEVTLVVVEAVAFAPGAAVGVGVGSDVAVGVSVEVGVGNGVPAVDGVRVGVGSGVAVGVAAAVGVGVGLSADSGGPSCSLASSRLQQSQTAK